MKKVSSVALTALLLLGGCTPSGDTESIGGEAEISDTYTIGGIAPLTGNESSYGIEIQRVAEMAMEDVNAEWAASGKAMDIQWEDGACNGKDASTAAQKLVNVDKVEVIFGGFCSSETLAAAAITDPAGVILFSPGSSSPDVTTAGDYVYRNWPSDAYQGTKLAELANELGYKNVAMLSEQQDYTLGISKVFIAEFETLGGTVTEETYLSEDTDFKTQLTKLKSRSPDVYFVNPQGPTAADVILKQMAELDIVGPFLLNDVAGTSNDILTTHSEALEGSYTATLAIDEDSNEILQLQNRYKELYGTDIAYLSYSVAAYDEVKILAMALLAAGNDGDAIKAYLNNFEGITGLMGAIDFDENGDPLTGHSVFTIMAGKIVLFNGVATETEVVE